MLLKSLEFFLAVAESGSFSLAAQNVYGSIQYHEPREKA